MENLTKYSDAVEVASNIDINTIRSKSRKRQHVNARYALIYILKEETLISISAISRYVNRSRSDVLHAIRNAEMYIESKDIMFCTVYELASYLINKK